MKVLRFLGKIVAIALFPVAIVAMIAIILLVWLGQLVYRLFKKFKLFESMLDAAFMIIAVVALVYADVFELVDDEFYD